MGMVSLQIFTASIRNLVQLYKIYLQKARTCTRQNISFVLLGSYSGAIDHWNRRGGANSWIGYDLRYKTKFEQKPAKSPVLKLQKISFCLFGTYYQSSQRV
jgi:hypothetical protein